MQTPELSRPAIANVLQSAGYEVVQMERLEVTRAGWGLRQLPDGTVRVVFNRKSDGQLYGTGDEEQAMLNGYTAALEHAGYHVERAFEVEHLTHVLLVTVEG